MDQPPARTRQVLTRIGIAVLAVVTLTLVANQPWNATRSSDCQQKVDEHVSAQQHYLNATDEQDRADREAIRNRTFAELGMQCGWEFAQAAEAQAQAQAQALKN